MKFSTIIFTATAFSVITTYLANRAVARERADDPAMHLENQGIFKEASSTLEKAVCENSKKLSPQQKEKAHFDIERMRRIRIDYSLHIEEGPSK